RIGAVAVRRGDGAGAGGAQHHWSGPGTPRVRESRPMSRPWWRDAVVYQIYIRSFADSDADGLGDLPGVIDRVPYIATLGVDAVWLTPFYPSPQHDHGYDVAD